MAGDLLAPPICAPTEPHAYCVLIMQRDAAENKLAKIEGENWQLRDQAQQRQDYWRDYVAGMQWSGAVLPYIVHSCAHSVLNKPKALIELCQKWKDSRR